MAENNSDLFVEFNKELLSKKFSNNNFISFGHYKQSMVGNEWVIEPIEWSVIYREGSKALLLSKKGLDCHKYSDSYLCISWRESKLRNWLNNEFCNTAFSNEELNSIEIHEIEEDNEIVKDKFFILDENEIKIYLGKPLRDRELEGSDYCCSKTEDPYNRICLWWTRTKSRLHGIQGSVDLNGKFRKDCYANSADIAVRPAILVNIYSDVFLTKKEKEDTVQRLFDTQDYAKAEKLYQKLGDEVKAKYCKYLQAKKLLDNGSLLKAYHLFFTISDYKDVHNILKDNEKLVTLKKLMNICSVGNTILFGKYYKNSFNEKEPIEWLVLKQDEDTVLVISKNAIDCKLFDTKQEKVLWGNSEICSFLNNTFFQEAFSEKEQECIWTSEVTNGICDRFSEDNDNMLTTINNNVFLLSNDEIKKYLPDNKKRKCGTTAYCLQNGAFIDNNCCLWWLRNQGYYTNRASYVDNYGQIIENGANVSCNDICVRPAIRLGLQNIMDYLDGNIEVVYNEDSDVNVDEKNFVTYLYAAYKNKIPLIFSGTNSIQIVSDFADLIDDNPFILDCNNNIEINNSQNVVILYNIIESEKLVEIAELIEKREKFYILAISENKDLSSLPYSFYNYALPIVLDCIDEDFNFHKCLEAENLKNYLDLKRNSDFKYEASNKVLDLLANLEVSNLTQYFYLKLLSDAHSINNQLSEMEDLLFMLRSYASATNKTVVFNTLISFLNKGCRV